MAKLIPLSDLAREHRFNFRNEGIYDPTGEPAYGADGQKIGMVRGAMVESETGRVRYLIVDVGGWFVSKDVLVPVGLARMEDDAVYFDTLTREQVRDMREYDPNSEYDDEARVSDERVLRRSTISNERQDSMPTGATDAEVEPSDRRSRLAEQARLELEQEGTSGIGYNKGSSAAMTGVTAAGGVTGTGDNIDTDPSFDVRNDSRDLDEDEMYRTPHRLRPLQDRVRGSRGSRMGGPADFSDRAASDRVVVEPDSDTRGRR